MANLPRVFGLHIFRKYRIIVLFYAFALTLYALSNRISSAQNQVDPQSRSQENSLQSSPQGNPPQLSNRQLGVAEISIRDIQPSRPTPGQLSSLTFSAYIPTDSVRSAEVVQYLEYFG